MIEVVESSYSKGHVIIENRLENNPMLSSVRFPKEELDDLIDKLVRLQASYEK